MYIPGNKWAELKKELLQRWNELSENEIEQTRGKVQSIVDLLENKLGLAMDEASEKFWEIASRYHIYEEPKEQQPTVSPEKKERILELKPKPPANKDRKPKDDFHL